MKRIAARCAGLSWRQSWKYPGISEYFAGLLSRECSRALVVACEEAVANGDSIDEYTFVEQWCDAYNDGGVSSANRRLQVISTKLREVESLISENDHVFSPDASVIDVMCSGDLHNDSFSTSLTCGNGTRLFFKPWGAANFEFASRVRKFLMDRCAVDSADWFNLPDFMDVDGHLVTRDVAEHALFQPEADLSCWYRKAGTLLAFSVLTGLTDLHAENLITAGGKLFLIDVDTLLHARIQSPNYPNDSFARVDHDLFTSVMATGLIPFNLSKSGKGIDYGDISGLTATTIPYSMTVLSTVDVPDNPEVRLWRLKTVSMPAQRSNNLPAVVTDGTRSLREFAPDVMSSFTTVIRWVDEHLDEFQTFLAAHAANVEVRCLVRSTASYSALSTLASSPLESSRRRAAEAVRRYSDGLDPRVVDEEIEQLSMGFIPVFRWKAMESPYGLRQSPLQILCERLSSEFLAFQTQLLAFFLEEKKAMTIGGRPFREILPSYSDGSLQPLVERLINQLIECAYYAPTDQTVSYALLTVDTSDELAVVASGADVYAGTAGLAMICEEIEMLVPGLTPEWFRTALRKSASSFRRRPVPNGLYESSRQQLDWARSHPAEVKSARVVYLPFR